MTKAFKSAAFVGIALVDSSVAMAAPITPVYDWSGFYIGLEAGGASQRDKFSGGLVGSSTATSALAGVYSGYNYQFSNNFVIGIEGRFDGLDVNPRFGMLDSRTNWTGSVVGRFGYAFSNFMLYASGGGAVANLSQNFPVTNAYNNVSGWTVGGGVEVNLTRLGNYNTETPLLPSAAPPQFLLRFDYRHYKFSKASGFGDLNTRICSDVFTVGIAAKFNAR